MTTPLCPHCEALKGMQLCPFHSDQQSQVSSGRWFGKMQEEIDRLREENARLRAVAEAAREVAAQACMGLPGCPHCYLAKALADAGRGRE